MLSVSLNLYQGLAVACLVYALGYLMIQKIPLLGKYCIPAPVVGGLVYALIHLGLYTAGVLHSSAPAGKRTAKEITDRHDGSTSVG